MANLFLMIALAALQLALDFSAPCVVTLAEDRHTTTSVSELALRFDGEACQHARKSANLTAWRLGSRPNHDAHLEVRQQILPVPSRHVIYVRNQKVASEYFWDHLGAIFKGSMARERFVVRKPGKFEGDTRASADSQLTEAADEERHFFRTVEVTDAEGANVFTFVREPIQTALAAYLEISRRTPREMNNLPLPAYWHLPCRTKQEATSRWRAFLAAVRKHEALSKEFFHAYPQALKIDIVWNDRAATFDAIGKLENLKADMEQVHRLFRTGGSTLPRRDHREERLTTKHERCSNVDLSDPDLLSELCDLYRADFECFDYLKPRACLRNEL